MWRLALVALAAVSATSLPDSTVRWDGMFHVRVHCGATTTCRGHLSIDPYVADDYSIAAGQTKTLDLDPAGSDNNKIDSLSSVVVRVEPSGEDPFEKTMKLVKSSSNPGPSPAPKPTGPPTKFQSVKDKRGDTRGPNFQHMDIVLASARRKGRTVVFTVRTANPPPRMHDGFGNPAAPCLQIPRNGPHAIETCGDARLRGYTMKYWPKVPFSISGRDSRWTIPLKFLPRGSFKWRAYVADGYNKPDVAPNKGYLTFIR